MAHPEGFDDRPVELAVHSMPTPQDMQESPGRTRDGRMKMLLVLIACAAPVLASYFTYYVLRPQGRSNFGVLVQPQRPLPPLVAQTLDAQAVDLPSLRGQWLLLSVAHAACDAQCQSTLFLQRQLRAGLGKDKDRVDWVWLIDDGGAVPADMLPRLEGATVLRAEPDALRQWLGDGAQSGLEGVTFLVDPQGNLMMRFPAPDTHADVTMQDTLAYAKKVKRDVERLLRASASWDTAGR